MEGYKDGLSVPSAHTYHFLVEPWSPEALRFRTQGVLHPRVRGWPPPPHSLCHPGLGMRAAWLTHERAA